jgi:hypothetical protein
MATYEHQLNTPPVDSRTRELWLQHAAGFIIFEDARAYAMARMGPALEPEIREAVQKGIDDAVYGLMMIVDGVSGVLSSATDQVRLSMLVRHFRCKPSGEQELVSELDLANGDGMCMGFHGWCEDDYGATPIVVNRPHEAIHSRRLNLSPRSARASTRKASSKKASSKKASSKKAS